MTTATPTRRPYRDERDFWGIRAFLRELLLLNDRRLEAWHLVRWEYWRFHGIENCAWQGIHDVVHLWEGSDGSLDAANRGLGRALLVEGMRRLAWYGAEIAYTASYGPSAGGLYESVGLEVTGQLVRWERAEPA